MSRLTPILLAGLLLVAAATSASNMAFALRMQLDSNGQGLHFVALPFEYTPANAEELCTDLGGAAVVANVQRWDEPTSKLVAHTCGSGTENFTLAEGAAYGVTTAAGQAVDALVVGLHDEAFSFTIAPTSGSNLSWVSAPYHAAIVDRGGAPGVVDAEDLCLAIGSGTVFAVVRWDNATSTFAAHVCGSVFSAPFPLTIGEGYGLVNAAGQTVDWRPEHY